MTYHHKTVQNLIKTGNRTEVWRGRWAIDALGECACTQLAHVGPQVAYRLVHCLAIRSCSALLVMYCVAILPTRGSAGLQSVRSEQMDRRTLEMVRAGLQLSLRMSRQITPWLLILQWQILVRKVTLGGLNGQSGEKVMSRKNTPPSQTDPGGPNIVDLHS